MKTKYHEFYLKTKKNMNNNKQFILVLTTALVFNFQNVFAQMRCVNSAEAYIETDIKQAKYEIDKAALHPETSNHPKMWFYKGAIYTRIIESEDKELKTENKDAALKAGEALVKFYSFPKKDVDKYKDEADIYIQNAAFACYNVAGQLSNEKGNLQQVEKYMGIVQKLIDADKLATEPKLEGKLSYERTYLMCLASAQKDSALDKEILYLDKLANSKYKDIVIFLRLSEIYLKKGDYAKATEYLNLGKTKYEDFKAEILKYEINIDIEQGKTEDLILKLNQAVANNPEDALNYFNRGLTYHQLILNAKEKKEKPKYYYLQAYADYEKSLTLDPNNNECIFNTGYLLLDSANSIFDKANALDNASEKLKLAELYKPTYKLAVEKLEIIRLSGERTGSQLVSLLNIMRNASKKAGDSAAASKYNQLYIEAKEALKNQQ